MAERLVAVDASALIGLAKAGAFDLLRGLFGTIAVTRIVCDEVPAQDNLHGAPELGSAMEAGWARLHDVDADTRAFPDLDAGESSTLALARSHVGRCLVVMDERLGRSHGRTMGIPKTGVAGILIQGKKAGLLNAVRPVLNALERNRFRLSPEVVETVLREAGELGSRAE